MKTMWKSCDGSVRSFDAMSNEHLANVLLHMAYYSMWPTAGFPQYDISLIDEALQVVNKRNLPDNFLDGAPYPHKDLNTGEWKIWNFYTNREEVINGGGPYN